MLMIGSGVGGCGGGAQGRALDRDGHGCIRRDEKKKGRTGVRTFFKEEGLRLLASIQSCLSRP